MGEVVEIQDCANCSRPIVHPKPGVYPPAVRWVHIVSPVGERNRHCDFKGGCVAESKRIESTESQEPGQ